MIIKKKAVLISLIAFSFLTSLVVFGYMYMNDKSNTELSKGGSSAQQAYEIIIKEFPEYKDFDKKDSFAGTEIIYQRRFFDQYVGFVVNGSGLPIVAVDCFKIDANNNITKMTLQKSSIAGNKVDLVECKLVDDNK